MGGGRGRWAHRTVRRVVRWADDASRPLGRLGPQHARRAAPVLLGAATAVVVAKNLDLATGSAWPRWGGDPSGDRFAAIHLVGRNGVLAATVAAVVLARPRARVPGPGEGGGGRPVPWWQVLGGPARPGRSGVDVAWTFGPAGLLLGGAGVVAAFRGASIGWVELSGIVFGTALLEEVVFRGLLLSRSVQVGGGWVRVLVPAVAFGFWHLTDALHDAQEHPEWGLALRSGLVVGTVVAMAAVSLLVFEPLRLRSGSIASPWLLHAAWNVSLVALGASI
jgi:membrane protease YdiL (CAAX protease family)